MSSRGTVGFTGTRHCEKLQVERDLNLKFDWFVDARRFVTGACVGFDAYAGWWLMRAFPDEGVTHTILVPSNKSQVDYWWLRDSTRHFIVAAGVNLEVIEMPEGSSYKDRNQEIVNLSDFLFYYAEYPEKHGRSLRSGTWQTVRMATKSRRITAGVTLNSG